MNVLDVDNLFSSAEEKVLSTSDKLRIKQLFKRISSGTTILTEDEIFLNLLTIHVDSDIDFYKECFFGALQELEGSAFYDICTEYLDNGDFHDRSRDILSTLIQACGRIEDTMSLEESAFSELFNLTGMDFSRKLIFIVKNNNIMKGFTYDELQRLKSEYGIEYPYRYNRNTLKAQLNENIHTPYGVMIVAKSDHNNSFNDTGSIDTQSLKDVGGNIRIIEVNGKIDLYKRLSFLDKKFGSSHKISFVIGAGHGNINGIELSNNTSLEIQDILNLRNSTIQEKVVGFFDKDAPILLYSCSTGLEGGLAQELSTLMDRKVIAPDNDINATYIDFSIGDYGQIIPDIHYSGLPKIKKKNYG